MKSVIKLFFKWEGEFMGKQKKKEQNLKGTLYMTFALGFIIIIVWAYCFSLFTDRM
jgi:hypothetical protein